MHEHPGNFWNLRPDSVLHGVGNIVGRLDGVIGVHGNNQVRQKP